METIVSNRLQFDILDLMRSVRGFERPDGYAVFPQDVVEKIEAELLRLYSIEEASAELLETILLDLKKDSLVEHPNVQALSRLFIR